jgi:hypothetical protein
MRVQILERKNWWVLAMVATAAVMAIVLVYNTRILRPRISQRRAFL